MEKGIFKLDFFIIIIFFALESPALIIFDSDLSALSAKAEMQLWVQ